MACNIQIRLGNDLNSEIYDDLCKMYAERADLGISKSEGERAPGGFALAIPPEVLIAVASAATATVASEAIKAVWAWIRSRYLEDTSNNDEKFSIVINGNAHIFGIDDLKKHTDAPDTLIRASESQK